VHYREVDGAEPQPVSARPRRRCRRRFVPNFSQSASASTSAEHRLGDDTPRQHHATSLRSTCAGDGAPVRRSADGSGFISVDIGLTRREERSSPFVTPPSRPPARLRLSHERAIADRDRVVHGASGSRDATERVGESHAFRALDRHERCAIRPVEPPVPLRERAEARHDPTRADGDAPPRVSPASRAAGSPATMGRAWPSVRAADFARLRPRRDRTWHARHVADDLVSLRTSVPRHGAAPWRRRRRRAPRSRARWPAR